VALSHRPVSTSTALENPFREARASKLKCAHVAGTASEYGPYPPCNLVHAETFLFLHSSGHQSKKPSHNLVKMRKNWDLPAGRVRSKLHAKLEVNDLTSRSLGELPPTNQLLRRSSNSADGVLYSFDRSDTPGRPLTLDIFVKAPTARDTERFVEKEYEILDTNGEALKGRKARNNLRQTTTDPGMYRDVDDATEDDGFELL